MLNAYDYLTGKVKASKQEIALIEKRFDEKRFYINYLNQLCSIKDGNQVAIMNGVVFIKEIQTKFYYDGRVEKIYVLSGLSVTGVVLPEANVNSIKLENILKSGELYPGDIKLTSKKLLTTVIESIESTKKDATVINKFDFLGLFKLQKYYCYVNSYFSDQQIYIDLPQELQPYLSITKPKTATRSKQNLLDFYSPDIIKEERIRYISLATILCSAMSSIFELAGIRYPYILYFYGENEEAKLSWIKSMTSAFYNSQSNLIFPVSYNPKDIIDKLERINDSLFAVYLYDNSSESKSSKEFIDKLHSYIIKGASVKRAVYSFDDKEVICGSTSIPVINARYKHQLCSRYNKIIFN